MNDYTTRWLGAYHDGELKGRRAQQVQKHLSTCETCRRELKNIQAISTLLASVPEAKILKSPKVFVAEVSLRIPRKPSPSNWQQVFKRGWQMIPIGILATWAFIQAAIIVSGLLSIILHIIPGWKNAIDILFFQSQSSFFKLFTTTDFPLTNIGEIGLEFLRTGNRLNMFPTLSIGLTVFVGMLYLSWLASWWILQTNGNNHISQNK